MGIVVMESGYGSPIPTCVVAYMDKTGAAFRCGLLNVGDHIMSINGVSVIGLPLKSCIHQIKVCKVFMLTIIHIGLIRVLHVYLLQEMQGIKYGENGYLLLPTCA